MMKQLLESVLEKTITELTFLNNEIPVNSTTEKVKTVDVLVLADNEYIHIELNSTNYSFLHNRNFRYFASTFDIEPKRGEKYDRKTKFIHIDFTYGMSSKVKDVSKYYVKDDDGNKYVDNVEIIEFNMDSLKKYCYTKSRKYDKYKHLIMLDLDEIELNNIEGDEFMDSYKEKVKKLNEDLTFRSAFTYEEDQQMILNTEKSIAFDEGVEQGRIEQQKEIVKNMYDKKYSLETIADITKLTIKDIKNILKEAE